MIDESSDSDSSSLDDEDDEKKEILEADESEIARERSLTSAFCDPSTEILCNTLQLSDPHKAALFETIRPFLLNKESRPRGLASDCDFLQFAIHYLYLCERTGSPLGRKTFRPILDEYAFLTKSASADSTKARTGGDDAGGGASAAAAASVSASSSADDATALIPTGNALDHPRFPWIESIAQGKSTLTLTLSNLKNFVSTHQLAECARTYLAGPGAIYTPSSPSLSATSSIPSPQLTGPTPPRALSGTETIARTLEAMTSPSLSGHSVGETNANAFTSEHLALLGMCKPQLATLLEQFQLHVAAFRYDEAHVGPPGLNYQELEFKGKLSALRSASSVLQGIETQVNLLVRTIPFLARLSIEHSHFRSEAQRVLSQHRPLLENYTSIEDPDQFDALNAVIEISAKATVALSDSIKSVPNSEDLMVASRLENFWTTSNASSPPAPTILPSLLTQPSPEQFQAVLKELELDRSDSQFRAGIEFSEESLSAQVVGFKEFIAAITTQLGRAEREEVKKAKQDRAQVAIDNGLSLDKVPKATHLPAHLRLHAIKGNIRRWYRMAYALFAKDDLTTEASIFQLSSLANPHFMRAVCNLLSQSAKASKTIKNILRDFRFATRVYISYQTPASQVKESSQGESALAVIDTYLSTIRNRAQGSQETELELINKGDFFFGTERALYLEWLEVKLLQLEYEVLQVHAGSWTTNFALAYSFHFTAFLMIVYCGLRTEVIVNLRQKIEAVAADRVSNAPTLVCDDDDDAAGKVRPPALFTFQRGAEKSLMRFKDLPIPKHLEQPLLVYMHSVRPLLLKNHLHSDLISVVSLLVDPSGGAMQADYARAIVLHSHS